nr:class I tRNA ligase family protein [Bauldia sp.]
EAADALAAACRTAFASQQIHQALNAVWAVVADANRYFAASEPWALKKTDPARMGTVLYVTAEVIRQVAILAQPVMPTSAGKLLDLLAVAPEDRMFAALGPAGRLKGGAALPAPQGVFPRHVDESAKA